MNLRRLSTAGSLLLLLAALAPHPASADTFVAPVGGGYVIPLNQTQESFGITTGLPGDVTLAVPAGAYVVTNDEFNNTSFVVAESNGLLDQGVASYLVTDTDRKSK